jgi:hypothetical protein
MTTKDYIKIAAMINVAIASERETGEIETVRDLTPRLAAMLREDNSRFNEATFFKACGIS